MSRNKVGKTYRKPDLWVRLGDLIPEYRTAARRALLTNRIGWTEVGMLCHSGLPKETDCGYGCKIYAAQIGAVLRVAVFHNAMYGCTTAAR